MLQQMLRLSYVKFKLFFKKINFYIPRLNSRTEKIFYCENIRINHNFNIIYQMCDINESSANFILKCFLNKTLNNLQAENSINLLRNKVKSIKKFNGW